MFHIWPSRGPKSSQNRLKITFCPHNLAQQAYFGLEGAEQSWYTKCFKCSMQNKKSGQNRLNIFNLFWPLFLFYIEHLSTFVHTTWPREPILGWYLCLCSLFYHIWAQFGLLLSLFESLGQFFHNFNLEKMPHLVCLDVVFQPCSNSSNPKQALWTDLCGQKAIFILFQPLFGPIGAIFVCSCYMVKRPLVLVKNDPKD